MEKEMNRAFRIIVFVVIVFAIILGFTWHKNWNPNAVSTSTVSYLKVEAKQHSKDDKQLWIIASDPNSQTTHQHLKVLVKDPMVWNLIQVNDTYFTGYDKHRDGTWTLDQISMPGDSNALR